MPALTFQDLSTELTQAIEKQLDTPTGTQARCTLGREKVMVLVEYPAEGGKTPPPVDSTLDWLEQSLRQQFDTVGLPEEAADLTETGEAVAVQLFLKHLSEPKPFTARSFVWKVADGFDDLFGDEPTDNPEDRASEEPANSHAFAFQDETGSLSAPKASVETEALAAPELDAPELDAPELDASKLEAPELEEEPLESSSEPEPADAFLPLSAIDSQDFTDSDLYELDPSDAIDFSLPGSEPEIDLEASELELPTVDLPLSQTEGARPSDDGFFDMELESLSKPSAATDSELAAAFEKALDENALDISNARLPDYETNEDIEFNEDIFDELLTSDALLSEAQEQNQPQEQLQQSDIETWQALSAKVSEQGQTTGQTAGQTTIQTSADSVNPLAAQLVSGTSTAAVSLAGSDSTDHSTPGPTVGLSGSESSKSSFSDSDERIATQFDGNALDNAENWNPDLAIANENEAEPGEDLFEQDREEDAIWPQTTAIETSRSEISDLASDELASDETDILPAEDSLELEAENSLELEAENSLELEAENSLELEAENSLELEADSLAETETGFDEYGSDEYSLDEYEQDSEESETAREDLYHLEQTAEDDGYEEVALIDEGEVQKQREQWQQQTKGNPWFFIGAIGFFAVGLIGFVLTRPCSFGACPRIETAQSAGEKALSDLTLDANLEAVTAAKKQLRRSVQSLQPIPFWSSHYTEAQTVLPQFEGQLSALDRVSAAQDLAWKAALDSQGAPHSSKTWEGIADRWRNAIAILESVPADNSVRRLANKKLTEYRANLSTIKVRIDAEAKAEESLSGAQQAATIATATANQASSLEDWESALENWELAVERIDQIPQGTLAYEEAQGLQIGYRKEMELVRDRTLKERNASRNLSKAKQLASDAERVESEDQWTVAVQTWTAAVRQIQELTQGTAAHAAAQPLASLYQQSLERAENNRQVSLRFQPVEPSFYAACGATATQKCTYSVSSGNVRLNLLKDYDLAINQSITPPDQRNEIAVDNSVVTQSNQLLKEITLLSTQAQVPIELYDAQGEFLARYRPDLNGFVKDRDTQASLDLPTASLN